MDESRTEPTRHPHNHDQYPVVLLVDDQVDILYTLQDVIKHEIPAADVVVADSARLAMEILNQSRVDIVVSDYRMPGSNGFELFEEIEDAGLRIPRILMTAYPTDSLQRHATAAAHVAAFFPKPLPVRELVQTIQRLVGGEARA